MEVTTASTTTMTPLKSSSSFSPPPPPPPSSSSRSSSSAATAITNTVRRIVMAPAVFVGVVSMIVAYRQTTYSGDPIRHLWPNILLWTPYKKATKHAWDNAIRVDTSIVYEKRPIRELTADEWSFDAIKEATEGFRVPAVVRGMFKNTTAVQNWYKPGYLSSLIGDFVIPTYETSFHDQDIYNHQIMTFRDAYEEIIANPDSRRYIFFPIPTKHKVPGIENVTKTTNRLAREHFDYDRFWPGFGDEKHPHYFGSQIITGNGAPAGSKTTGSFWHCAMVNNWFIQVIGEKYWEFLDQDYSSYMKPQRYGLGYFAAGGIDILDYIQHLPVRYTTLYPGDMLYNPEWMWHYIQNEPGLTLGVPIRERVVSRAINNNLQFSLISITNVIFDRLGIRFGLEDENKHKD